MLRTLAQMVEALWRNADVEGAITPPSPSARSAEFISTIKA
jgi:hypothetical protein